jgi:AcrR family transcriptional regulator
MPVSRPGALDLATSFSYIEQRSERRSVQGIVMEGARNRILDAAIEAMIKTGDVRKVTMRDVASRAEVGLGAVNYHFQTKENLVNVAVRRFIDAVISGWTGTSDLSSDDSPVDQFRKLLATSADFLAEHPRVSRISILFDAEHPDPDDNTGQVVEQLTPFAVQCLGPARKHLGPTISRACVAAMQLFFLRSYERNVTPSFFVDDDRSRFLAELVETVFGPDQTDAQG